MRLFSIIFTLLVISATYGCTTAPERPSYAETHEKYQVLHKEAPQRVIFEFDPVCSDEGICKVREERLYSAAKVIALLNDAVAAGTRAYNTQLDALAAMEYALMMEGYRADQVEAAMRSQTIISSIKQVLTTGLAVGAGLMCLPNM